MKEEMKRAEIRIYGQVHGVFFRQETKEQADARGLFGWVRNEPDGTVKIVVEGEGDRIDKLINWAHQGPPHALVKKVEVKFKKPKGKYFDFSIWR